MSSRTALAARAALGLVASLLPAPHRLGDARLFALARLHLWPGWRNGLTEDRDLIARFLGQRPDSLGEDEPLLDALRDVLGAADDFVASTGSPAEARWDDEFTVVPGRLVRARVTDWIIELEAAQTRADRPRVQAASTPHVDFVAADRAFRIPRAHLPTDSTLSWRLTTTPPIPKVVLDKAALRDLARRIDAAGVPGARYEDVAVDGFLDHLASPQNAAVNALHSGPTQLIVAPTGSGKSVFARLMAIDVARRGVPVALVVPDIQMAWKEVLRLRAAAQAASLDLRIVALSSWRDLARRTADHLDHPPPEDPDGRWALDEVAYSCLLAAYADPSEDAPEPGDEPCTRLRRCQDDQRQTSVACPFAGTCGRFSGFARTLNADIVVVNHHAFLEGRVPLQVACDNSRPHSVTIAELVLRRCGLVLIDEIDGLQNTAIASNSGGLVLSSRGALSLPYQLLTETEGRRAELGLAADVRFERGRSALLRIIQEAEKLSELINRKELAWPGGRMIWREAMDGSIAGHLFSDQENPFDLVRALFDRSPIEANARAEALRQALAPAAGPGLGDGTLTERIRADLMLVLQDWPDLRAKRPDLAQRARSAIIDSLLVRAALVQLDRALTHLRPQLPGLEQRDITHAGLLRDALLGYRPWQPSPAGALGQALYGYAFSERGGEQGALETRVLSGDPHGLIAELGGLVAHARAGTDRIVVGFSATCRFKGAPRSDVLAPVVGAVEDKSRNVRVLGAAVKTRVSGVGQHNERMEAARAAAAELWESMLGRYLEKLVASRESAGRARALVVTGSYDEAEAVTRGLLAVAARQDVQIRRVVAKAAEVGSDSTALPRTQLESFGQVAAPAILVAPLSVVARGHNILQPGSELSALTGIFVVTRPVPPSHDAARFLAHVSYDARVNPPAWRDSATATVMAERRQAWARVRALHRSPATFRHMDSELRRELVCDVLVDLAQLAGRARRGRTPVDLVFVDAAFQDEIAPWRELVSEVLAWWRERGWLSEMTQLHGALISALADYANFQLDQSGEGAQWRSSTV